MEKKFFLDNIFDKDTSDNKLFLKIIFAANSIIFTGITWLIFKSLALYLKAKKLEKIQLTGELNNSFTAISDGFNDVFSLLSTASNVYNIFKFSIFILLIILIVTYLKLKKYNEVDNFKDINYISSIVVATTGITLIFFLNKIITMFSSFNALIGSVAQIGNIPNPKFLLFILILNYLSSLISAITNYFFIFKNQKINIEFLKTYTDKIKNIPIEKKKKYLKILSCILGAWLLFFISSNYIFLKKFDFEKNYTLIINGTDGNAKAYVVDNINLQNFQNRTPEEINFINKGNIAINISKNEKITNDDVINVEFTYDNNISKLLKIKPVNSKFEVKVEGLPKILKNINDSKNLTDYIKKYSDYFISKYSNSNNPLKNVGAYTKINKKGDLQVRVCFEQNTNTFWGPSTEYTCEELTNFSLDLNGNINSFTYSDETSNYYFNPKNIQELEAQTVMDGFDKLY